MSSERDDYKIDYVETVNITNEKHIFISDRTREDVIKSYLPPDVEEHIWRCAAIENIMDHLNKIQIPLSEIAKFYKWLDVKRFKKLESLNNIELFKVHEYVTSLPAPWRISYTKKIETCLKRKKMDFTTFKMLVSKELNIKFNDFDELSDLDISRVRYLAMKI